VPDINRILRPIDHFQQRHRWAAFPWAVNKKFGDDQGGNLSALITYYGFLSLFPLLLVLVTVLSYVLEGNEDLRQSIIDSAVADLPVLGDQIKNQITSVRGTGVALFIGVLVTLYGGLGIANALQNAMNRVWAVPMRHRPGFFPRIVRSLALIGLLGVGILVTTMLSQIGGTSGARAEVRIPALVASLLLNLGLFIVAFRVLTSAKVGLRDVLTGAIVAAIGWELLQILGRFYVQNILRGMSQTYGLFATVLGLLAWLFLQARLVMYSAEVNAVRKQRLWPRSMVSPPYTDADLRAFALYTATEERAADDDLAVESEV
jgi:membrane protein